MLSLIPAHLHRAARVQRQVFGLLDVLLHADNGLVNVLDIGFEHHTAHDYLLMKFGISD